VGGPWDRRDLVHVHRQERPAQEATASRFHHRYWRCIRRFRSFDNGRSARSGIRSSGSCPNLVPESSDDKSLFKLRTNDPERDVVRYSRILFKMRCEAGIVAPGILGEMAWLQQSKPGKRDLTLKC
jgi:hypothetical protein